MANEMAKEKAAMLLKKRTSVSSMTSAAENTHAKPKRVGSVSTMSFIDDPGHDGHSRPAINMEPTYRMEPDKKFPVTAVTYVLKEVLDGYLADEKYEPDLCRQMSKTLSDVVRARVKEMQLPRYKIICIVHIGQLHDQGINISSRFLWDRGVDSYSTYEFRNNTLFAIGTVYAIYSE